MTSLQPYYHVHVLVKIETAAIVLVLTGHFKLNKTVDQSRVDEMMFHSRSHQTSPQLLPVNGTVSISIELSKL